MLKVGNLVKHREAYSTDEIVTTAYGKIKELSGNGQALVEFHYDALEDEFTKWKNTVPVSELSTDFDSEDDPYLR